MHCFLYILVTPLNMYQEKSLKITVFCFEVCVVEVWNFVRGYKIIIFYRQYFNFEKLLVRKQS